MEVVDILLLISWVFSLALMFGTGMAVQQNISQKQTLALFDKAKDLMGVFFNETK